MFGILDGEYEFENERRGEERRGGYVVGCS